MFVAAADNVFFEAAEKGGKARAPAKRHDAESAGECLRFGRFFLHRMT